MRQALTDSALRLPVPTLCPKHSHPPPCHPRIPKPNHVSSMPTSFNGPLTPSGERPHLPRSERACEMGPSRLVLFLGTSCTGDTKLYAAVYSGCSGDHPSPCCPSPSQPSPSPLKSLFSGHLLLFQRKMAASRSTGYTQERKS